MLHVVFWSVSGDWFTCRYKHLVAQLAKEVITCFCCKMSNLKTKRKFISRRSRFVVELSSVFRTNQSLLGEFEWALCLFHDPLFLRSYGQFEQRHSMSVCLWFEVHVMAFPSIHSSIHFLFQINPIQPTSGVVQKELLRFSNKICEWTVLFSSQTRFLALRQKHWL